MFGIEMDEIAASANEQDQPIISAEAPVAREKKIAQEEKDNKAPEKGTKAEKIK
jgi:hypothetical protein